MHTLESLTDVGELELAIASEVVVDSDLALFRTALVALLVRSDVKVWNRARSQLITRKFFLLLIRSFLRLVFLLLISQLLLGLIF